MRLLDDDESLGQVDAVGDEPTFIQSVLPEHLENVDFTFFASDETFTRKTWPDGAQGGQRHRRSVLCAGRARRECYLRAPWVERELGITPSIDFGGAPVVIAHPAAMVLALLLLRIQKVSPIDARGGDGV